MNELVWESLIDVRQPLYGLGTWRAKVPGGWLVTVRSNGGKSGGLTFYPDPHHQWDGGSLP